LKLLSLDGSGGATRPLLRNEGSLRCHSYVLTKRINSRGWFT